MSVALTPVAGWLLHSAAGGGLLLLLAWGLMRRTHQPARQQRLGEWGLAAALLAALLSLGPAWLVVPWQPAAVPEPAAASEPPVPAADDVLILPAFPVPESAPLPAEPPEAVPASPPAPPSETPTGFRPDLLALLCLVAVVGYAAGALLLLGRWLLGHVAVARLLRQAVPAPAAVARLFAEMAGGRRVPRLLVSHRLRVPACCGLWRPTVLLPAALCAPPVPDRLRWVFAHELAHLRRRDAWSCLLFELGQVLFFYLPWFWRVRRQVRLCQEHVADAAAAGAAGGVADYAEFLLSLSAAPAVPLAATGVSGSASDLYRRVTMLLQDPLRVEQACPRRWLLTAAASLLALAVVVAGVGVQAAAADTTIIIVTDNPAPKKEGPTPAAGVKVQKDVLVLKQQPDRPALFLKREASPPGRVRVFLEEKLLDLANPAAKPAAGDTKKPAAPSPDFYRFLLKNALDDTKERATAADVYRFLLRDPNVIAKPPEASLEALRKALKKLEGYPDKAALEEVRKEIQKALDQIQGPAGRRPEVTEVVPRHLVPAKPDANYAPPNTTKPNANLTTQPSYAPLGDGRLGIHVAKPGGTLAEQLDLPKGQGLVITAVYHEMPAGKAGLKVNDVLLELAGKQVPSDPAALPKILAGIKADTAVDAVVVRRGRRETIKGLTLAAARKPAQADVNWYYAPLDTKPLHAYGSYPANVTGGGSGILTTTYRNGDRFSTRYQEGSLIITITGNVASGKAVPSEIHVQDGTQTNTYGEGNVPARYRDRVEHLLQSIGQQGSIRIENKEQRPR
jgi:beta-lactamase regulating signal transducer with metallopeptidase domain